MAVRGDGLGPRPPAADTRHGSDPGLLRAMGREDEPRTAVHTGITLAGRLAGAKRIRVAEWLDGHRVTRDERPGGGFGKPELTHRSTLSACRLHRCSRWSRPPDVRAWSSKRSRFPRSGSTTSSFASARRAS